MAERSHIPQCISSSDALLQTQQRKDFCNLFLGTVPIYQEWPFSLKLPVTASVPLSSQRPCKTQTRVAEYTAASDHDPLCLQPPAGAPASPQLKHNSQDRPARVFPGNSFLHNPALRHLLFAAVQLRRQSPRRGIEGAELSLPSGRCPPYAMPLQSKCHSCASWDLCLPRAWPSFPWGTILHPL